MASVTLRVNNKTGTVDDAFVDYFSKERAYSRERVLEMLEELGKYLFISSVSDRPVSPPLVLDDLWHELILWDTRKYLEFSRELTGRDIHHRRTESPYPRTDLISVVIAYGMTLSTGYWAEPLVDTGTPSGNPKIYTPTLDGDCG
jgi:hypothetical protein